MVLGALAPKPAGYCVVGLALTALLIQLHVSHVLP
jgi:hypothetical protein